MLKKFLRTSVLTLGAGLCVLATLQKESHATVLKNEYNEPLTFYTQVYLKYKNHEGSEEAAWGETRKTSIGAGQKMTLSLPDKAALKQLMGKLDQVVHERDGIPLTYGFTVDSDPTTSGLYSNTLYNDAYGINILVAAMQRPMKAFIDPQNRLKIELEE